MLTKQEFKEAFREAMDKQLEADLAAEPDMPELSPEFRKKMEELIRTGKPNNKKGLSKRGKRILIIAIAAVLALTLTACAVPEIRESIAGFFVKIFSDHVEYSDPAITRERIDEEYCLDPIPEGFTLISENKSDDGVEVLYADGDDNTIMFHQSAKDVNKDMVDNEHGEFYESEIGGKTVWIHISEVGAKAAWVENGYYFSIDYGSSIDSNIFESWIESVRIKG